jgi:putative membrane protein
MTNGYAMSGWGWLLMTLGMLGFWALVAVVALALLRRPGQPDQQRQPDQQPPPGAEEILAQRLARSELDPRRVPPTPADPLGGHQSAMIRYPVRTRATARRGPGPPRTGE